MGALRADTPDHRNPRSSFRTLVVAIILLGFAEFALGAGASGMISALSGDASYKSGQRVARVARYMTVQEGDELSVARGTRLRLVYFQGGRQETYRSASRFTIGRTASRLTEGAEPDVSVLPGDVTQRLVAVPELIRLAKNSQPGGITIRSVNRRRVTADDERDISFARKTYEVLRAAAPADDITAELYLYAVLYEKQMHAEMRSIAAEMQRRRPSDPDVSALASHVK